MGLTDLNADWLDCGWPKCGLWLAFVVLWGFWLSLWGLRLSLWALSFLSFLWSVFLFGWCPDSIQPGLQARLDKLFVNWWISSFMNWMGVIPFYVNYWGLYCPSEIIAYLPYPVCSSSERNWPKLNGVGLTWAELGWPYCWMLNLMMLYGSCWCFLVLCTFWQEMVKMCVWTIYDYYKMYNPFVQNDRV